MVLRCIISQYSTPWMEFDGILENSVGFYVILKNCVEFHGSLHEFSWNSMAFHAELDGILRSVNGTPLNFMELHVIPIEEFVQTP